MRRRAIYILLFFTVGMLLLQAENVPIDSALMKEVQQVRNDSLLRVVPLDSAEVQAIAFDKSFKEKYRNDDYDYSEGGGGKNFVQKIKEFFNNFLRKLLGLDKITKINDITQVIYYVLLGILFLAILYIVVRLIMNHKGPWFFEKESKTMTIDLENVETHIHEADFDLLIAETEQKGNTRQSIRLHYLRLLKDLSDNNLIEWHPEKTNADYVREINDEAAGKQFHYLSYLFNHIWYGEFSISDIDYQQARKAFRREIYRKN